MNPSDGGGHDTFEWWANINLPALGILVSIAALVAAILVPLAILKRQRRIDDERLADERALAARQLAEERGIAHDSAVHDERKRATREVIEQLAPFIGINPFQEELHPRIVRLRVALMVLVDEYPASHPINELVGLQHHLGSSINRAILEEGPPTRRANMKEQDYVEALLERINPLSWWAARFTNDVRLIQSGDVDEDEIRQRSQFVMSALVNIHEKNGWGTPPEPNLRRREDDPA
ncbi:hypothetical protein [Pseudactinotalea sp.]|uniref:hypothetical protein n=1 Tax=Pseudactinotalea sp. TaxID=1926260 RepID=UPI003B3AF92D